MAWRRTGDKPLSESMMIRRIYASLGLNELKGQCDQMLTHWGRGISNAADYVNTGSDDGMSPDEHQAII